MTRLKIHDGEIGDHTFELYDDGKLRAPVAVDGVHAFKLEGDKLHIDLFTIAEDSNDQCQRRDVACRLTIPAAQFGYMAQSIARQMGQFVALAKAKKAQREKVVEQAA